MRARTGRVHFGGLYGSVTVSEIDECLNRVVILDGLLAGTLNVDGSF